MKVFCIKSIYYSNAKDSPFIGEYIMANKCRIKTEGKKIKVNIIEYFNNDYLIERMRERERERERE